MSEIRPGSNVIVTDANGADHQATATSGVMPGRDFPVVWVYFDRKNLAVIPWPASDVRPFEATKETDR